MRLISFGVSNYKSFLNKQFIRFDQGLKNVDVILGPNGSGKSNYFMAIRFFRDYIRTSTRFEGQNMQYLPFMLNDESEKIPTTFQAEMQTSKHVYRYDFSLLMGKVVDEVLSRKDLSENSNYVTIFSRKSLQKNRYEKYGFDSVILKNTRDDALILTKAWENNNKYALEIFEWLKHLKLISGDQPIVQTARKAQEDADFKTKLLDLLRRADLYIRDIDTDKINMPDEFFDSLPLNDEYKSGLDRTGYSIKTTHILRNGKGEIVGTKKFLLDLESEGTKRIFELAFPLLDTLENGNMLYIDELETHLHPRECEFLIELFTSTDNNKKAQLIANTHNTQVMDQVGRNNIHLFGKNTQEETIIKDIPKDIRTEDPSLEKKYKKGMFGAVPNISG